MYSRGKLPCPPRSRALHMLSKADPTNFNSTVSRGTCGGMWVGKKNLVTLLQLLHYSLHILIKTSSIQWSHFPQAKNSPFPCQFFHLWGHGTASFLNWHPLLLEGQIPMPYWVLFPFPLILSFFLEKYQVKPSNIVTIPFLLNPPWGISPAHLYTPQAVSQHPPANLWLLVQRPSPTDFPWYGPYQRCRGMILEMLALAILRKLGAKL